MADTLLNQFVARGTAAERAAFTPDEPSPDTGPVHAYLWWETDTGDTYTWDGAAWQLVAAAAGSAGPKTVGVTVDGGGTVITTGQKGYIQCPITGTITKWTLLADQPGDVEFDVTLDAFASFPPTTSIVASAPPVLSGADSDTDSTLTGWATSVTAGDVFGFEVVGTPDAIMRVTLQIEVTP